MNNILITSVSGNLLKDIETLRKEIGAYKSEESIWKVAGEISNAAGNLCLHLCGNLQHFFGHVLGGTDYIRNRDAEFSTKYISREALLAEIDNSMKAVKETMDKLDPSVLEQKYPVEVGGKTFTTGFFLIYLVGHFNYHLGQINYHRRLLDV